MSTMSFSGFYWNAGKGCTSFPDLQFINIVQKGEGVKIHLQFDVNGKFESTNNVEHLIFCGDLEVSCGQVR